MLNLGTIQLPLTAATKTFAILAKRGAGKSYTGAVMAEEFYKNGIPFVVFDPIDVWWGLRLAADGKTQGLPVVVFGLEHADLPLQKDMGRQIAQAVVSSNISCVLSTFGMPKSAQRHLIYEFSDELLKINNTPRHIFIEEAHEFVPQRVMGDMGKTFNAVSNLIVMGRNRGIGVTLINQRAATINKDVLTQIDTLLAFRNVAPQDRQALREWVEHHGAEDDFNLFMQSLPNLPTGEGWVWSPEFLETFERIKIRKRETYHPDRETLGQISEMPQLQQGDIQSFIAHFNISVPSLINEKNTTSRKTKVIDNSYPVGEIEKMRQDHAADILELEQGYDEELRKRERLIIELERKLDAIDTVVHGGNSAQPSPENKQNGNGNTGSADIWINKVGSNTSAGKILRLLVEKHPMKYTRTQIRTLVGISARSSGFGKAMAILRRNNLIAESGDAITVNEDLL